MNRNSKGFSIMEAMLALGLIGAGAVAMMTLFKNSSKGQTEIQNSFEYVSLFSELSTYLAAPNSCKASIAGINFRGSTIQSTPVTGLEIWSADQAGNRVAKKLYQGMTDGNLTITEVSLTFPDYTAGTDFPVGNQTFVGNLKIKGTKRNSENTRPFKDFNKSVFISFTTDGTGNSVVSDCSPSAPPAAPPSGGPNDSGTPCTTSTGALKGVVMYNPNNVKLCCYTGLNKGSSGNGYVGPNYYADIRCDVPAP